MNDSLVEKRQAATKADSSNATEFRTTYETRAIIGKIYEKLPPELRDFVTSPNWVLTVAGARGLADSEEIEYADESVLDKVKELNEELARRGIVIYANIRRTEGKESIGLAIESLKGYAFVSSRSEFLSELGIEPFFASTGLDGLGEWKEKLEDKLSAWAEKEEVAQEIVWDIYSAICYGYPDRALNDFIASQKDVGAIGELEMVDILSIHPQAEKYPSVNSPEYGVSAMSMNSPTIRQHVTMNQKILKDFYDTDWMRKTVARTDGGVSHTKLGTT